MSAQGAADAPSDELVLGAAARALLFTGARTANAFTNEPVTDDQLRAIFSLARWPPTMANTNPLRWLVVRSEDGRADAGGVDRDLLEGTTWRSILVVNVGRPAPDGAWFDRLPRLSYDQLVEEI